MRLVAERYRKLRPVMECLADEVVMALAWKKTHAYMRTHNWYADTLALDISAIGLETNAQTWESGIRKPDLQLRKMELVPAAKSESWRVDQNDGWVPSEKPGKRKSSPPIRPLAHLTVRDQTWATAVMMCLADAVESAQGDCSIQDFYVARNSNVYSYGNRLLCDWRDRDAWFRWGNGETYRKFFTDYQSFLKRPIHIGRMVGEGLAAIDQVFVINLDIARFYDCIDRKTLLKKLRKIATAQDDFFEDEQFWTTIERVLDWQWDAAALKRATDIGIKLGNGLPQGLVSAGFFANAYLIDFDSAIGKLIGSNILGKKSVVLHDYARYVDDLRLVVSVGELEDPAALAESISKWINEKLRIHGGDALKTKPEKTKIVSIEDLDNSSSLSGRIAQLQSGLSGPTDRDSLDSMSALLEGLLTVQSDGMPGDALPNPDASLVRVAKFDGDVKADTLKRFAANRLETVMRAKRKVDFSRVDGIPGIRSAVDNESELLAKKMIWAWMQDPSLALVLRKGLEIFPSPDLAEPVLDAVFRRCSFQNKSDVVTGAMFDYLLADLFRFCVELDARFETYDYPSGTDVKGLLALAAGFAQKAMASIRVPEFVARQALMLLAVRRTPLSVSRSDRTAIQYDLHDILSGKGITWQHQRIALYEVATQITGEPDTVASQFLENASLQSPEAQEKALEELAKRGGKLWNSVWTRLKKDTSTSQLAQKFSWAAPQRSGPALARRQSLHKLSSSSDNGFVHEAALLKLALELIKIAAEATIHSLSPRDIVVSWTSRQKETCWSEIWHPDVRLKCEVVRGKILIDPRFESPKWLVNDTDARSIYWIGSILRSVVIGSTDFTSGRWQASKTDGYKGLRTAWYKRRIGLMQTPEVLVGDYATLSTWSAELLMKCLQWPGFESTYLQFSEFQAVENLVSLEAVIEARLKIVNALVCSASNVPSVVTTVNRHSSRLGRKFRLVAVQQLLPRTRSFSAADLTLSNPKARVATRDHLSRMCEVVYRTLVTQSAAETQKPDSKADLIVFPEVAVHPDDLDLLKRLADKSRSMIFAGLIFCEHEGKIVNTARWIIPSFRDSGRQWIVRNQGKQNMTRIERSLSVSPFRPCQHIIEVVGDKEGPFTLSGTICYDATDLKFVSDMAEKTDLFVVAAHNKDVTTFDTMASALHYHMYQHVVVVNKGEFGGSTIQAPYKEKHHRLISHAHGVDQISINVADLDLAAFKRTTVKHREVKDPPAGL